MGNLVDLTGQRFGRWLVLRCLQRGHTDADGTQYSTEWECRCECGKVKPVKASSLKKGVSNSCGCLRNEQFSIARAIHNKCKVPEYGTWRRMISRCLNPKDPAYLNYGGRGIDMDPRWLDINVFLNDMGSKPSSKHSIERVKNEVGYWPWNCVWATGVDQANNRRSNRLITLGGVTKTVAQWSRETGIKYGTIMSRIRYGWDPARILNTLTGE